jgi:hypothetical protein
MAGEGRDWFGGPVERESRLPMRLSLAAGCSESQQGVSRSGPDGSLFRPNTCVTCLSGPYNTLSEGYPVG